jgi:hypothetical protein
MKVRYDGTNKRTLVVGDREYILNPAATYVWYDEDVEKSTLVLSLLQSKKLVKISDEEPLETTYATDTDNSAAIISWVKSGDVAIQFADPVNGDIQNTYSGTHGTPVALDLVVTNGSGVTDTFNSDETVIVTITGGSSSSKTVSYKKIDGTWSTPAAGPVTPQAVKGVIYLKVDAADAGTITLGLSSPLPVVLNVADTAEITLA